MKASDNLKSSIGRCTDVGKVRSANEDSMGDLSIDSGHVLIVADGMGGYRGGALASHLVVEAIEEYFRDASLEYPQKSMKQAINLANERIYLRGQQDEELSRMGSTCVLAIVQNNLLHIAHVGDSRIYLLRKDSGSFQQLTRDHTVVQHFVDVGLLNQEEAEGHPDSHILSRALGPRAHVEPEVCETPLELYSGDRVILCSDGLTKMIRETHIEEFTALDSTTQAVAEKLVELANDKGGEDNITVIIFEYLSQDTGPAPYVSSYVETQDALPAGRLTIPLQDVSSHINQLVHDASKQQLLSDQTPKTLDKKENNDTKVSPEDTSKKQKNEKN